MFARALGFGGSRGVDGGLESGRLLARPVARAVLLRLTLAAMMRRRALPELLRALTPEATAIEPAPLAEAERALAIAERLSGHLRVVPRTCLYRALARYAVLRRAGHPARFVMGLRPRAPEITGHAWVELDGAPVGETLEERFAVTFSYPDLDPSTP